jgi:ElaB/YqjD/DUF883 family membrane-anchored ribosome-binding protein
MNSESSASTVSSEKLVADLKVLIADSEELLRASAGQAGEKMAAARERIQASIASMRVKLVEAEKVLLEKTKQAAKATDAYVHEHPWKAVGIAAGVGFVLGLLISRR